MREISGPGRKKFCPIITIARLAWRKRRFLPADPAAVLFRFMVYIPKAENDADPLRGFFRWPEPARQGKMGRLSTGIAV